MNEDSAAIEEIIACRSRLVDQRGKATESVSSTLRTIGMGLAAISYSFVFASTPSSALASQKTSLFIASALGALSVFLDMVQSFAERQSAQGTLNYLKSCRDRDHTPTPQEIEHERAIRGGSAAYGLLIFRFIACILGVMFLMIAIANTLQN